MNIVAVEKTSKKEGRITITNDQNRLSKDEIDQMIKEAEVHAKEDEVVKKRIEAKNEL